MNKADIGVIGLAVMGENLILNMERNGFAVACFNRTTAKTDSFLAGRARGKNIIGCRTLDNFLHSLSSPRKVMLMVKAGKPVDELVGLLLPHLQPGDLIIDGGNSFFEDTIRRARELKARGLLFIGTGISGGEEGALNGPSIMPGGHPEAWPLAQPIFRSIAAKVNETPCCDWIGDDGAGHFVKMVHNGIEYGDMQMIAEAYAMLQHIPEMSADEMAGIFKSWNQDELNSYLIEITAEILAHKDEITGQPMVDAILDTAGQKGTGKWTGESALNLGVPTPTIVEAVFARGLSAMKEERTAAARQLKGPSKKFNGKREPFVEAVRKALYASKICSYAQGFHLMRTAAKQYGWDLNYGSIASIWRGGCIIRAQFLDAIKTAFEKQPALPNLLVAPYFRKAIQKSQSGWRKTIAQAALFGVPVPAFSSALAYFDAYRSDRLPANLLQAQRDYFGAHTYERTDRPRGQFFHTDWTGHGGSTASTVYGA